ncbi:Alpha-L-fucosidase, partial [mine drainage metagenome]
MRRALSLACLAALSVACGQPFAGATAAPAAAHPVYSVHTFPPLWNEPKDYEKLLHQQMDRVAAGVHRGPFKASWRSLEAYHTPRWFRNANSASSSTGACSRCRRFRTSGTRGNMYVKDSLAYDYERAVYGPQSKFGYKNFIPKFTMAKFNPKAWAALFKRAGARYVVPVAEHCDGFPEY